MGLTWNSPLAELSIFSSRELDSLDKAGLRCVRDLLMRIPRRYEDRRRSASIATLPLGEPVCLRVRIQSVGTRYSYKSYVEAIVSEVDDAHGARLCLRWFNMPYLSRMLAVGQCLFIYGKATNYGNRLCMMNPDFEVQEEDTGLRLAQQALGENWTDELTPQLDGAVSTPAVPIHTDRIVPVYRNVSGLAARRLREIIWQLLQDLDADITPAVYDVAPSYKLYEALNDLHFPKEEQLARKARMRFALSECFLQQFKVQWRRQHTKREAGQVNVSTHYYLDELLLALPFQLTGAQQRCLAEISADMAEPVPMNRLLQGDVGSGKTLVALGAMLMAFESGKNAALMAPTQILAQQHYKQFKRLLKGMDIPISLRTADSKESSDIEGMADDGRPRLYVGTHALLYKKNKVNNLGLAVIDEQHKFGVKQRELFTKLDPKPDVLVMSATPIPRTMTLTLYGDLDVSIIDEMPATRGQIITALRNPQKMERIIAFMQEQLAEGRQIYIVSPLVEESEKSERRAATQELERWQAQFPDYEVELLHGRMSPEEKAAAMSAFKENESAILVATTVVEVGVDVPNATIMIINDADSYGLSQLHQLRGRIGRGQHKSYCILLSESKAGEAGYEKLNFLCRSLNGFDIAEEDFRLRGPGDVLGIAQSGLSNIQFPEWLSDMRLLHRARKEAADILARDPDLQDPAHVKLRALIAEEEQDSVTA
ncbi:MAG: ATP-dependent DNA helicase RecG [Akkermansia sp.]